MKTVVSISLGPSSQDFEFTANFLGEKLHVRRLSTPVAEVAIGLGVLKESYRAGAHRFVEQDSVKLTELVRTSPITTGGRLGDIFQEWAVRHAQVKLGNYFNNARVLFFSGLADFKLAMSMAEYTPNLRFADPVLQLGVPKMLTSLDALQLYATGAHYVKDWPLPDVMAAGPVKEWTRFVLRKAMQKASVIVAPVHSLDEFGLEELAGKTVITAAASDKRVEQLRDKGVHMIIDGAPELFGHVLAPNLLDAMILAATGKDPGEMLEDDYLEIITDLQIEPRIIYPNGFKRVNRFAFVIHPLSQEYFKFFKTACSSSFHCDSGRGASASPAIRSMAISKRSSAPSASTSTPLTPSTGQRFTSSATSSGTRSP